MVKVEYFPYKLAPRTFLIRSKNDFRMGWEQGDQMSFCKNRPKYSPTHFFLKLIHTFTAEKSSPNIWATFVIFEKLPKEN
jgi:hypothetical protein